MTSPFEPYVPSVFVVSSPFQAFCAVATICNLKISDYRLVVVFNEGYRDKQLRRFLESANVDYVEFHINKYAICKQIIRTLFGVHDYYERLFIGNFNNNYAHYLGYPLISKGAAVVYLDDGTATLSLLTDSFNGWGKKRNQRLSKLLSKRKGVVLRKYFYTIYSDVKNSKYVLKENDLSKFWSCHSKGTKRKHVLLIGTDITQYCTQMQISEELFIETLKKVFDYIISLYSQEKIVYIPHGSDVSEYANTICKKYDAEFHKVDSMVELYFLQLETLPCAVFGLSSTALLNIKKIAPDQCIYNIFFYKDNQSKYLGKYKSIYDYYKLNDIICKEWKL